MGGSKKRGGFLGENFPNRLLDGAKKGIFGGKSEFSYAVS